MGYYLSYVQICLLSRDAGLINIWGVIAPRIQMYKIKYKFNGYLKSFHS